MKCFLNNQYIGVPCYLVDFNYNGDKHELCQISTHVGDEYYYDLKNDVNGVESLDPVANDQAFIDMVWASTDKNSHLLRERVDRQVGRHITEYAEEIGLGTTKYELVDLDK